MSTILPKARDALRGVDLFRTLPEADLDAVLAGAAQRSYDRGVALMRRGEPGGGILLLLRGQVRVSVVSPDGREMTLGILGPGDVLGEMALLDGEERSADATALEPCTVLTIDRGPFLRTLRASPDLCLRLLTVMSARLRRANLVLEDVALLDLPSRLGRLLSRLASEYGTPDPARPGAVRIGLRLSQKDLGGLIGSSREKVNRQLRLWEEQHVLMQSKGYIIVLRPAGLAETAE